MVHGNANKIGGVSQTLGKRFVFFVSVLYKTMATQVRAFNLFRLKIDEEGKITFLHCKGQC